MKKPELTPKQIAAWRQSEAKHKDPVWKGMKKNSEVMLAQDNNSRAIREVEKYKAGIRKEYRKEKKLKVWVCNFFMD